MKVSINCETGEILEREWTEEEIEQAKKDALELAELAKIRNEQEKIKAQAKAALLDRLGITEEEAKLLLS